MKSLNRSRVWLLSLALLTSINCEHKVLSSMEEYHWRGHTFPIAIKIIDGVEVRYVAGLVNFTTKSNVTITQLQPIIKNFDGEILAVYQPLGNAELDITMKIPYSLDPFEVADQLERSPLIKYAEPVFLSTPE